MWRVTFKKTKPHYFVLLLFKAMLILYAIMQPSGVNSRLTTNTVVETIPSQEVFERRQALRLGRPKAVSNAPRPSFASIAFSDSKGFASSTPFKE